MNEIAESPAMSVESLGYRQELHRSLSLMDLLVYGLAFIVPAAPIAVFGFVFNASHGMVPLVYAVGLVAMLLTASSYAAMARVFPVSGSVYAYAGRALGESMGFIAGWMLILDYLLIPSLVYILCAVAVASMVPSVPSAVWMIGMLVLNTAVNLVGIENTARFNLALMVLQFLMLATFFVVATVAVTHHVAGAHFSAAPLFDPGKFSAGFVFAALSLAVLSFLGFDAISTLAEEAKGGGAAVGKATILSLVVTAIFFVAQTWLMCLFVLGVPSFAGERATAEAPYTIMAMIGGPWLKFLVAIVGTVITGIPAALTAQAATARLLYSMARDGRLPRFLSYVSPKRKVPDYTIIAVALVTVVLSLGFYADKEVLISMVNFGALSGFMLLHASVIAHFVWREKNPNWVRYLVVPLAGLAIIGYVLVNMQHRAQEVGLAWLAIGLIVLVALKLQGRRAAVPAA